MMKHHGNNRNHHGRCYAPGKGYSYRSLIQLHCKCHKPHELKEQTEQETTNKHYLKQVESLFKENKTSKMTKDVTFPIGEGI